MKTWIIILLYSLPTYTFSQVYDSISPQPEIDTKIQKINLEWADTILNKVHKICFVQLRPLCDDGKKRKTIPTDAKKRKKGCYMESVIKTDLKYLPKLDSSFMTQVVLGLDSSRMYKWREIDTTDYLATIESSLGTRKSNILTMCYIPRHAVVFLDSSGHILGIYEICFECGNGKIAFNYTESISMYSADYRILKDLFIKYGFIE